MNATAAMGINSDLLFRTMASVERVALEVGNRTSVVAGRQAGVSGYKMDELIHSPSLARRQDESAPRMEGSIVNEWA